MSLSSYQRDVVLLLFAKQFEKHLDALGTTERDRKIWKIHRRMARSRLRDGVTYSFPRLVEVLGDRFEEVFAAWLDRSPPKTPYYRQVAGEFAEHVATHEKGFLPALARYEWALLAVEYAHEEEGAGEVREVGELSFERPAVLAPTHRILHLPWSVHRLSVGIQDLDQVVPGEFALCLYRDPATHETRVLELSASAAAILEEVAPGEKTVVEAVKAASARVGFAIDAEFVGSLGELVADLVDRGVWLGSAP
ncbi:MAG: HvfC family peptide modification chaperone [Polyangiales bacterium]